ncbi:MAG: rhomboid family intramembrane serine protease [Bacteroidales bacterium]|nr:rhomboid family intramembrane serine protease [Bacteroidales bacterium]
MNGGLRGLANIPPVLKNLLIINILMFLISLIVERGFGVDLNQTLGLHYFKSEYFQPYQFVTHMFMHGGVTHIFLNMFMLWMFGRVLEQVWGGKRFLIYYFVTGLGAAALHMLVMHFELSGLMGDAVAFSNTPSAEVFASCVKDHVPGSSPQLYDFIQAWIADPNNSSFSREAIGFVDKFVNAKMNIPTVGASGAVYGVLLAFGVLFPNMPLVLIFLPFFPIKAKYMVMGMAVLELMHGLTMTGSNVAHFAHLGGMIFGYLLIRYWKTNKKNLY